MSDFRVTKVKVKWEQIQQTLLNLLVSTGNQSGRIMGFKSQFGSSNFSENFTFKKRFKNKNHHR